MRIHLRSGDFGVARCKSHVQNSHLGMYSPTLDEVYLRAITGEKFKVDDHRVCKNCRRIARVQHHGSIKQFKEWEKTKPKRLTRTILRNM